MNLRRLRAVLGPGVFLVIGVLLLCAIQWFSGEREISQIDRELKMLLQEKARLAAIVQAVNQLEARLEELTQARKQFDRMTQNSSRESFQKGEQ
jgi:acyl carrier protein phosphodiesterase